MVPQNRLTLIMILALLAGSATSCTSPSSTSASAEPSFDGEQNSSTPSPSARPSPKIEALDVTQLLLAPPEPQLPDVQPAQLFDQALRQGMLEVLERTKDQKSLLPYEKFQFIRDIAIQMAEAGEVEKALQAVSSLEVNWNKVEVLSEIALKLINQKQVNQASQLFEQALEIAETVAPDSPSTSATTDRVSVLVNLSTKMIEGGQRKLALQALSSAVQIAETSKGDNDSKTYRNILAINLAKVGQFEQALKIAETIQTHVVKVKAWSGIAVELASVGQVDRAKNLLSDAMKFSQSLTDGYMSNGSCYIEKSHALGEVAKGFAQVHQIQQALKIAKDIKNCSGAASPDLSYINFRGYAYSSIIKQITNGIETDTVLRSIQTLEDGIDKYELLAELALRLAEQGKVDQAIRLTETIGSISDDNSDRTYEAINVLSRLSTKLLERKAFEPVFQIIKKFQDNLPDEDKAALLIEIGKHLVQAGRSQQAIPLFSKAFQLAQTGSTRHGDNSDLRYKVAAVFASAGQVKIAMQLVRITPPVPDRASDLAIELAKVGQFKLALQMAQRDVKALASIAVELSKYQTRSYKSYKN